MPLKLPIKNLAVSAVQKCLLAPNMVWNTMLPPQKSTCQVEEKNIIFSVFTLLIIFKIQQSHFPLGTLITGFTMIPACRNSIPYLAVVYTMMDHEGIPIRLAVELVPGPLQFTARKDYQSDYRVQGPQKTYFKACIIH